MINFFAGRLSRVLGELHLTISTCGNNERHIRQIGLHNLTEDDQEKLDTARDEIVSQIDTIAARCKHAVENISSPHIDRAIASITRLKEDDFQWADCKRRFITLREAITIELEHHFYYQYKKDKGLLFFNWKPDWQDVISAFPNAEYDIFSAVDCYALEHATASVFHSMRIAEIGLRAIATNRGLQLPKDKLVEWATWQEIIRALDEEISKIGKMPAGREKDRLLSFYSGARADINGFKDEYRNVVMHVRMTFDEYQAASALMRVKDFMKRLAAFGLSTVG